MTIHLCCPSCNHVHWESWFCDQSNSIVNYSISSFLTVYDGLQLSRTSRSMYNHDVLHYIIAALLNHSQCFGTNYHTIKLHFPQIRPHRLLAYMQHDPNKSRFRSVKPYMPTVSALRTYLWRFMHRYACLVHLSLQQKTNWRQWNIQILGNCYPSVQRNTCRRCQMIVPSSEMQTDSVCIFCYARKDQVLQTMYNLYHSTLQQTRSSLPPVPVDAMVVEPRSPSTSPMDASRDVEFQMEAIPRAPNALVANVVEHHPWMMSD